MVYFLIMFFISFCSVDLVMASDNQMRRGLSNFSLISQSSTNSLREIGREELTGSPTGTFDIMSNPLVIQHEELRNTPIRNFRHAVSIYEALPLHINNLCADLQDAADRGVDHSPQTLAMLNEARARLRDVQSQIHD
jgi:hypothetical protein